MTVGILIFGYISTSMMWLIVPFVITFSLGWGCSVTSRLSLMRESFGRASFGKIMGFNSGMMMLGHVTGAPLAGWVYDTWGSYQGAWLSFGILTLAGAAMVFTLPTTTDKYKVPVVR
jgi:predicted MFS family arabinose efflux permease